MKTLRYLVIISIFAFLFAGFFHKISAITQDLGRHFLLGEIILKTLNVPKINLFSYTYPNFPFINLHWLSEIIFYLIYRISNYNGLLIFSTIIVIIAFAIIFFKSLKKNNLIPVTIGSILYLNILFERTDIRPEIFSFLFLSFFILILYKNKGRSTKLIYLLPLLELLWVNLHIYFAIGIAVIGIFFLDQLAKSRSFKDKKTINILIVLILSSITTLFNPNGITGAIYPFIYSSNYGYTIEENQNIFFLWNLFHNTTIIYFALTSLLLTLSFLIAFKKSRLVDLLLSSFFIFLGASAIRNFPLFVFGTFIAFVHNLSTIFPKISFNVKKIILATLIFIICYQTAKVVQTNSFGFGIEPGAQKGADFFLANKLKGPLFNNFDVGGYLDYRFYPKERVFVDNRPGEYPSSFFQKVYIPMQQDPTVFENVNKKYKFNIIFFSYLDQTPWANIFLKNIANNKNWKIIYLDDYSIILAKDNEQNEKLISEFGMTRENLKISNLNEKNEDSLINLAVLFNKIGWQEREINMFEKILVVNPEFCPALYNLASYYSQKNDPLGNIYSIKFQSYCK